VTLLSRRWLPAADSRRFLSRSERRLSKACDLKIYAKTLSDRLVLVTRVISHLQLAFGLCPIGTVWPDVLFAARNNH